MVSFPPLILGVGAHNNSTEDEEDVNAWNCSLVQAHVNHFRNPLIACISVAGLLLNLLVIFVIRESMNQRRTQAQIHLMALAISDLTHCAAYVAFATLSRTCDFCPLQSTQNHTQGEGNREETGVGGARGMGRGGASSACFTWFNAVVFLWLLSGSINRSMTLYISFIRAQSVKNGANAQISRNKAPSRIWIELGAYTIILTFFNFCAFGFSAYLVSYALQVEWFVAQAGCLIAFILAMICAEMTLAIFVLVKLRLRKRNRSPAIARRRFSAAVEDDFEKLVALVALMYCSTYVVPVIQNVFNLSAADELETAESPWEGWSHVSGVVNSSVNFVVYLVASRGFFSSFVRLWKKMVGMCQ